MPLYEYRGYSKDRRGTKGVIEAGSMREAKEKLRSQGMMVSSLVIPKKTSSKHVLRGGQLVTFTLQLSQLVRSGLPLYESLMTLEEQYRGESYHRVIASICERIKAGSSLSEAMKGHPQSFDRLYVSMVAAGEASGALDMVLERLSLFLTKQQALKSRVATSMIYPGILATFAVLVIILLLTFVVPSMEGILEGRELNTLTATVLGASHLFTRYWLPMLICLVGGVIGFWWWWKTPSGQLTTEKALMRTPFIGRLIVQAALSRLSRTMATLLQGGLTLVDALRLARGVMQNQTLEKQMEQAETRVVQGGTLSQELRRIPQIPSLVPRLVAVAEDTGDTGRMWNEIADMYEGELDTTLERVLALAQPLILVFMGFGIGFILLGILLPLTDVASLQG